MAVSRSRLIRPFFLGHSVLLLVVFLGVLILSAVEARRTAVETLYQRLETAADLEEDRRREWIAQSRKTANFLSGLPELEQYLKERSQEERSQKERVSRGLRTGEEIQEAKQDEPARERLVRTLLSDFAAGRKDLAEVQILDADGLVTLSSRLESEGEYRTRDRFFQEGKRSVWVQEAYVSPQTLESTISIAAPVKGRLGVLALHLRVAGYPSLGQDVTGLGDQVKIYFVDRLRGFVAGDHEPGIEIAQGLHSEGIDGALRGRGGRGEYDDPWDVPVYGVFRWLPDLELVLLAEIPLDAAASQDRERTMRGLVFLMLGIPLCLILSAIVSYQASARLFQPR